MELQPKAEIVGDVYYKVIEMALGAAINGNLVREPADANRAQVTRLKPVGGTEEES
jgi:cytoskeletal protein CcmA (bactofilin family)